MNRRLTAVFSAFLLVVIGYATPVADPSAADDNSDAAVGGADPDADRSWPDDPPTGRLSWETGCWYDESITVDQSDGLDDSEMETFVARTMARVEVVRELEFEESVSVEVISHAEYRGEFDTPADPVRSDWNDQVQEALLLVSEDRIIDEVFDELYGNMVLGYYPPSEGRIVAMSNDSQPTIDRRTLAHELVRTAQDRQFGLDRSSSTQDAQLAHSELVEGDAHYVSGLYKARCEADWDCVPQPSNSRAGGKSVDYPVSITIYTSYSKGPTFVSDLCDRGGQTAVNAVCADHPTSTEQALHPTRYPDKRPVEVMVEDRLSATWARYDTDPTADTVGEASVFAAFWKHHAADWASLQQDPGTYSPHNYTAEPSEGWADDAVVPYHPASDETYEANPHECSYVQRTIWDTKTDAEQLGRAYVTNMLERSLNASEAGKDTYRVNDGPFADAYRVTRERNTVTVVSTPAVAQMGEVHERS